MSDFDLPQLEKIVVWNNSDSLIVLEGNKRLAGYKLLADPSIIIEEDKDLQKTHAILYFLFYIFFFFKHPLPHSTSSTQIGRAHV